MLDSLCGANVTRPLLLYGSDAGLGNRFGALLAGAAIGGVLGRPVSMKWTPKNMYDRSQNRSSGSATSLLELMNLPSAVQVLDSLPHTQSRSARDARRNKDTQAEIIWDARERFGPKFVFPEPSFEIYARVLPLLRRCSSKQGYLAAYRRAQAQLRVRYVPVILCEADGAVNGAVDGAGSSPTPHHTGDMNGDREGGDEAAVTVAPRRYVAVAPRQYMALHVRRGDRGRWKSPDSTNNTIASIMALSANGLKLPWLVVSDSVDAAQTFQRALRQRAGLRVCVVRGQGQERVGVDAIFRATIDDFGALQAAAGVITDVSSWGTWIESSFSTVAALSGATPLLYPWNSSTRMTVCRYCRTNASRREKLLTPVEAEVEFNNGEPMSGIFFLDSLDAFRSAVLTAGVSRVRPFALGAGSV